METERLLDECRRLYDEDDYQGVIGACDEILKIDFNNPRTLGYKARCLYLLERNEEALTLVDNALTLYPKNWHFLDIKAEVLIGCEQYGRAVECYDEILNIDLSDEVAMDFIRKDYATCLSLRIDQLIEMEKYVDAWKCYNEELEIRSADLEHPERLKRFIGYVKQYASRVKKRQYYVRISSHEAKVKLVRFLKHNGFKSAQESGFLFSVDVVDKVFNSVSVDEVGDGIIISESKFYDKVNYYPQNRIVHKKIYDEFGTLLYEGYTLHNAPYGFGKAYFGDGKLYREGIFDIKGIVQGKEYCPSGHLRFEGQWSLTGGYGPNAPYDGRAYDEDGKLIYSGKFEIKRGGVGWPMIQKPKGFPLEQKNRPKIEYYKSG